MPPPPAEPTFTTTKGESMRWVDAARFTSASLPSYVERRLQAAFDAIATEDLELRHG